MSVLLLILKIIGIALLTVLSLVLLAIVLVLFVPIRYKGSFNKGEDDDELNALVVVSWLLSIVRAKVSYDKDKPLFYELRVFGIRILSSNKKKKEKASKKKKIAKKEKDSKKNSHSEVSVSQLSNPNSGVYTIEEADPGEPLDDKVVDNSEYSTRDDLVKDQDENCKELDAADDLDINESVDSSDNKDSAEPDTSNNDLSDNIEPDKKHKKGFITRIREGFEKLKNAFKKLLSSGTDLYKKAEGFINKISREYRFYNKFLTDERNKKAFDKCLKKLIRILKSIKPKLKGNLTFGMEDPASTGNVLIFLSILYPLLPRKFVIDPRFNEKIFKANLLFKGKIRLHVLTGAAISIYFDKNFKRMMRIYKKHKGK